MPDQAARKVCYVLKRFPRLSETFILNEILALERLGTQLIIVSLLPAEEGLRHAAAVDVQATIHYLPAPWPRLILAAARSQLTVIAAAPLRYLKAACMALRFAIRSGRPDTAFKKFLRATLVAAKCRQENIRHLHAHFANTPTGVAELVSVLCGLPYSFTTHAKDLYLTRQGVIHRRVASAKFVLTCTRFNLEYIRSFVVDPHREKIHLIYHGIDLKAFAAYFGTDAQPRAIGADEIPVILSVGRLITKKGMKNLISACALLRNRGVDFRCLIVGKGPLQNELLQQIEGLGLKGKVVLLGPMVHSDLVKLYGQATVFALVPQVAANGDRDGIPNVLVEAMAAGLPVLSTSISGIPELIEHGQTGLLVQPNDVEAVADALENLLQDGEMRRRVSRAARGQLKERFHCWESTKAIHTLLQEDAPS